METIERAVDSVASQTQLPIEVLLVDDASPDRTLNLLRRIAGRYPAGWIKIASLPENRGPSAARNLGWDMAKGKYVAFLDADDSWDSRKTELQYAWMERHPDVSLTSTRWVVESGGRSGAAAVETLAASEISPRQLLVSNRFCTSGVMLVRSLDFRFDESKRRSEDYQLWLTLALNGHRLVLLDAPLAIYYKGPFGDAGLSSDLWKMQAGQLDTYRKLADQGLIGMPAYAILAAWSALRFARRLATAAVAGRRTGPA